MSDYISNDVLFGSTFEVPSWSTMMFSGESPSYGFDSYANSTTPAGDNPNITNDSTQDWKNLLSNPESASPELQAYMSGAAEIPGAFNTPQEQKIESDDPLDRLLAANNNFDSVQVGTTGFTPSQMQSIQDAETGADAELKRIQEQRLNQQPTGKENSLMDLLNSKVGAGIAASLVSGLLGGVGSGAAAKANNKAQKEMLDQKYQQQLDYVRQMRQYQKIAKPKWEPVLSNGILGAK